MVVKVVGVLVELSEGDWLRDYVGLGVGMDGLINQ